MPHQTGSDVGKLLLGAVLKGAIQGLREYWPYFLGMLVVGFVLHYANSRLRRAERDDEYRRAARIFKEVNDETRDR